MSTVAERIPLIQLPIGESRRAVGVIEVVTSSGKKLLPLAGVDIQASVADRVASIKVTQKYRNTFTEHLEEASV